MRIIFVGGGTAGHINPALALAEHIKLQDPTAEMLYVGAKCGMEEKLVADFGLKFCGITISGFSRSLSLQGIQKNLITLKNILISTQESKKILDSFKPDICIGTGGYVCGPFLRQASKQKIPFIIHDSNSYPGVTTKLLAKKATKVMVVDKNATKHLPKNIKIEITGTPVRRKISTAYSKDEARQKLNLNNCPTILSFGGSLGAKTLNNVMEKLIAKHFSETDFNFIHGFGKKCTGFAEMLESDGISIKNNPRLIIKEYINNMAECMAAADLVICRAGATTLSELQSAQKPAILIPSPNVAENHQYYNAIALVNENAASIIEEKDLTEEKLSKEIDKILANNKELAKIYAKNLKRIAITDSCEKIYKIITNIIK